MTDLSVVRDERAAERMRSMRDRDREAEKRTAIAWLGLYRERFLGASVRAVDLYDQAVVDIAQTADGTVIRIPRRRVFIEAAREVLGNPRRTNRGLSFTVGHSFQRTGASRDCGALTWRLEPAGWQPCRQTTKDLTGRRHLHQEGDA